MQETQGRALWGGGIDHLKISDETVNKLFL